MSGSSGRGSSDSVHQANLATFLSFRKTIEDLTNNPRTVLGDHASLVRRIQEWRKTVSHLTVWVTDDRAYYQQARPEIVSLLEAVFDSVRAVDTVRSQIPGPNWVRASEKEFEFLLQDYIKLIEIAFPHIVRPDRGRILYNGLYSFKRRLDEVRGAQLEQRRASAPQIQQNPVPQQQNHVSMPPTFQAAPAVPRAVSQGRVENPAPQNGAPALTMQRYSQPINTPRTNSLPTGGTAPTRPVITSNYTPPHLVNGTQQLPQVPQPLTAPQTQAPVTAQTPSAPQPPPPVVQLPKNEINSPVLGVAPPEDQDWDLDINWDELEALDRSEWQANDSMQIEDQNAPLDSTQIAVETNNEQSSSALVDASSAGTEVEPASIKGTLIGPAVGESSGKAQSTQPERTTLDVSKPEVEGSAPQKPNSSLAHDPVQPLQYSQSSADGVIDIDELLDEEVLGPQAQKPTSTGFIPPTLDEDVINIQYSDDEMEVDELDPTEPPGSVRPSEQPDDTPTISSTPAKQPDSRTLQPRQPSTILRAVPVRDQQPINVLNSLPPHVRAEIRQKAKEPLISHYISITSKTREAAEARFQEMSDQEVFDLYDKMGHARRIVDHYRNMLVQSSHKIHLPHIDVREPPPEPPTLLCSVTGAVRLSSETVEFSISQEMLASLERWRARFVTPAGSHGDLITVELACYPKDAFRPSEGKGRHELTPNAKTRTWPDGGILWAFINSEDELKDRNVRLFLSPPPFVELNQPVDISDFIREGRNTVKFVHLGGMEHFIFAVQTRRMPPPHLTWPGVLKRIQSIDPSANGYSALINRISVMLEES